MYLKKIEMKGFKSFAEHTEIVFKPGINVVVGPNGCGKSNLVEAVRWVLGESNIRELRGQKSEDVIFNGTDKFRPLSMASVEIVLDNADNLLPLDYSEVSIGRKIFRAGESEFYINKSRVRMKDITKLFTGTGLGKCGYSIIGQGELEEVLNGAPLDRRLLLEEASGIIRYRQQRNEVVNRIASTGSDLIRIGDILGELKNQKDELEKKAEKAEAYLKLAAEFNDLKYKVSLFEIKRLMDSLYKQELDLQEKNEKFVLLHSEVEDKERQLKEKEKLLLRKQEYMAECKEEKHSLENRINELKSLLNLSCEKVKNKGERIDAARKDKVKYEEMLEGLQKEVEKLSEDYLRAEEEYARKKEILSELADKLARLEKESLEKQKEFELKRELVFRTAEEAAQAKNKLRSREEKLKKLKEKRERLAVRKEEIEERWEREKEAFNFLLGKKGEDEELLERLEKELLELTEKRKWFLSEMDGVTRRLEILNRQKSDIVQKLIQLEDIKKNFAGYSSGVRFVMKNRDKLTGILGILGELIEVPCGLETAIDAAGGRGLEDIVVDKAENAERAISFLKRHKAGRVTFLPLDMLKVQKLPWQLARKIASRDGVLGLASDLVKYEAFYEKAVDYLLGRVVVVNDIKTGVDLFTGLDYPLRIVTLEGEIINASGAMTGGSRQETFKTPLQYRSEEKKLREDKEKVEIKIGKENEAFEGIKKEARKVDELIEDRKKAVAEVSFSLELLKQKLKEAGEKFSRLEKEKKAILQEEEIVLNEIRLLEEEIKELYQEHLKKDVLSEEMGKSLEDLKLNLEEKKRDISVYRERLASYREQLDMKTKEIKKLKHNLEQFKEMETSYQESVKEAEKLIEKLADEIKQEETAGLDLEAALRGKMDELARVNEELVKERTEEEEIRKSIEKIKEDLNPFKLELASLEKEIKNLEIAKARLETELDAAKARFAEDFKQPAPCFIGEMHTARENNEYKKRMEILASRIEAMGNVDIEAIDAYREIKNRFDFMKKQYDDLKEAKESLEKLLRETEELMHKEFVGFLAEADKSFKKTFTEIFGGGEAVLRLEEAENKLNAGVEIEVKMPGKKTQALSLLSGGERSLTCIAFIFALLRLKPAPFCLLDEIDAALDETNLVRFARFIKRMSSEVQFIIITHRQAMIEAGETIYGITMPEKGVSSVLTLSMKDVESMAG